MSLRVDKVRKYQLCRQCLKSLKKVSHKLEDCRAKPCSNCQGSHNRLLCTKPVGEQKVFETVEEEKDDGQDRYGDQDVMSDNLQHTFSSAFHTPNEDLEMEDPADGEWDEVITCMYMDMYIDAEEEDELWTILLDENLMSVMMSMPLDRMKMEEEAEITEKGKTESTLKAILEYDVATENPTPELTEQLADKKTGSVLDDASNVG